MRSGVDLEPADFVRGMYMLSAAGTRIIVAVADDKRFTIKVTLQDEVPHRPTAGVRFSWR